jgi:beta-phosphoglucomutase-like phosphatase (HAD superfamily)
MIRAIIFDLDGTLVQTEALKAISYARAAVELCPDSLSEQDVIEAFKEVVGLSRKEVAQKLMERFGLEEAARAQMDAYNTPTPWQAFVQKRMGIYESMISDPDILLEYRCPYNVGLLKWARREGYMTGLATMSHCQQASAVLQMLHLKSDFNFIATVDDVDYGKPDPEIYHLVAKELGVSPDECLVIEDSRSGVKAALAAGMGCVVVTTDFTRQGVHESGLLEDRWIVDSPSELLTIAKKFIAERSMLRQATN